MGGIGLTLQMEFFTSECEFNSMGFFNYLLPWRCLWNELYGSPVLDTSSHLLLRGRVVFGSPIEGRAAFKIFWARQPKIRCFKELISVV